MFVNLDDNLSLDEQGFAPFAEVIEGFDVFGKVCRAYEKRGPDQQLAKQKGNAYLIKHFPLLSYISKATRC